MLDQKVVNIAMNIGQFYLNKNNGDYDKATQEIVRLNITKINFSENGEDIIITTSRPGLLIGCRGENIADLAKYLNMKILIVEDNDSILNWLIPLKYDHEDFAFDNCDFDKPIPF